MEHVTEIVVNHNWSDRKACGWTEMMRWRNGERGHWRWHYHCKHSHRCSSCGKYTEYWLKNIEECPDYKPREIDGSAS